MNGQLENENAVIDRRPKVTCAGELEVFALIEANLSQALTEDTGEWRRSLGRIVKNVHIAANFVPFSPSILTGADQWDLIRHPLFHIYWTDCFDIDIYKNKVKEDIEKWIKELHLRKVQDWLIVIVENYDGKRTKQLIPRTTVLDKIRVDFGLKQGDRCISFINPGKPENKTADSWRCLVARIRHLLLVAYARAVSRLEDYVRQQKERRNDAEWDFMNYFGLQEELAQALEMLGLYDETLLQYDELEILFSQFVMNFTSYNSFKWLNKFQSSLERWHGFRLGLTSLKPNPSLLELRAYIFAKQSQMLLSTNKVWEMARRCLPFLHSSIREIEILEISTPPGSICCWLFLVCMEILHICNRFNQTEQVEEYSLHTAPLWEYASLKLYSLGELCGLMPKSIPTSEQLHIVVSLSAGMGDNPGQLNNPSATDKLKEALCSKEVFSKTYLELAELAMGTYKHVGRLRMARMVGKELASFYILLGETQKAAAFLNDIFRTFENEGWHEIASQTQLTLAECYKKTNDTMKYIKSCAYIAASMEIDVISRCTFFDELICHVNKLTEPLELSFDDIFKISSVRMYNETIMLQGCDLELDIVVESNFPKEVVCTCATLFLKQHENNDNTQRPQCIRNLTSKELKFQNSILQRLGIKKTLNYKQNRQMESSTLNLTSTIQCKNNFSTTQQSNFEECLEIHSNKQPIVLTPGLNTLSIRRTTNAVNKFYFDFLKLNIAKLNFVSPQIIPKLCVEIKTQEPSITLNKETDTLLLGTEQVMSLILTVGSSEIEPKSKIRLIASQGLALRLGIEAPLKNNLEIEIENRSIFSVTKMPLRIFADQHSKNQKITIQVPWNSKPIIVPLNFLSPFSTSWKLCTVGHRKFVQVNVVNQCLSSLIFCVPTLKLKDVLVCSKNSDTNLVIKSGLTYFFLWELIITNVESNSVKAEFGIQYKLDDNDCYQNYQYFFEISDFKTMYIVDATVEPTKGNEFCRVGIVCHLNLSITNLTDGQNSLKIHSIMYEVLAEQSVWAVTGRTAGVISFPTDDEGLIQRVVLDIMPLTSGFLPLPLVRISKYIPADNVFLDKPTRLDNPRLEPFSPGQVYNKSKGKQLYIIPGVN